MEIFETIREYPRYSISTYGQVICNYTRKTLKPSKKPNGYMQINLFTNDGRRKKEYIHRLVAITFLKNPTGLPEVNHIDGVRDNNRLDNLEWVSRRENVRKSAIVKRIVVKRKNGNQVGVYFCIQDACRDLGLTDSNVTACLIGKQKTHKGYIFETL